MTGDEREFSEPLPLADSPDGELIDNIKNGVLTNESLKELINRHSGIYFSIANRYFPENKAANSKLNIDRDLVFNSKDYIIYNSALSFNKDKGAKFSTHVGNQAKYFCLGQINKSKDLVPFEQKDFENMFSDEEVQVHDRIDESMSGKVIEIIKNIPDERVYEIFRLRYLESKGDRVTPWSKIYKKIPHAKSGKKHLTIQGCINLHDKALKEIRKRIKRIQDN